MLGGANFLTDLQAFGAEGKDLMNEETVRTRRGFLPFLNLNFGKTASTPSMRPHESPDVSRMTRDGVATTSVPRRSSSYFLM